MNLLAHAYLSEHDPELLLGNMLGDDVKGLQIKLYPPKVRAGIQLHRYIDSFTDQHTLLSEARAIYRPAAGLFAGPLLDITLDYFLANDPAIYSKSEWQNFASWAYKSLDAQSSWHTGGMRRYFPYLKKENWFIHYAELPFIENTMRHLLTRVGRPAASRAVILAFKENLDDLSQIYQVFFPELAAYATSQTALLLP